MLPDKASSFVAGTSDIARSKKDIAIIGAGCASLSLAAKANELPGSKLHIIDPPRPDQPDHIWGFWAMDWLDLTRPIVRKSWHKWAIVTEQTNDVMQSEHHPYQALNRHKWLARCRDKAYMHGVNFHESLEDANLQPDAAIFDSRPPQVAEDVMLQHFAGFEVRAPAGSFDDSTAILMDFRCDQSRGMHFIYCLPFSDCEALVESTLFSPEQAPQNFYEKAIADWLGSIVKIADFEIIRREAGVIPLGLFARHDPALPGIGGNAGAIRPSSGYAFTFIQKQINRTLTRVKAGKPLTFDTPHRIFDLWMDRVFLSVLRHQPKLAPQIFSAMAARLNGDEFAMFLSGEATMKLRCKVVIAMPKWPFLRAMFRLEPDAS